MRECITQNVDYLHEAAGHHSVLHSMERSRPCSALLAPPARKEIQKAIETLNGINGTQTIDAPLPDGDIPVNDEWIKQFQVPDCERCGGFLKPDVVFFGGNLAPQTKEDALNAIDEASALMVVGSSVQVFSGYRLCRRADEQAYLFCSLIQVKDGPTKSPRIA